METRGLAVTVSVFRSITTAGSRPSCDGAPCPGPAPPPGVWMDGGQAWGLAARLEQLGQLQGESPAIRLCRKVSGEEQRRGVMRQQRMMGVGRVGEKGLLLCGIGVGVGGAGAVQTEAAPDQRSSTEPVAPPTETVGARSTEEIKSII